MGTNLNFVPLEPSILAVALRIRDVCVLIYKLPESRVERRLTISHCSSLRSAGW